MQGSAQDRKRRSRAYAESMRPAVVTLAMLAAGARLTRQRASGASSWRYGSPSAPSELDSTERPTVLGEALASPGSATLLPFSKVGRVTVHTVVCPEAC